MKIFDVLKVILTHPLNQKRKFRAVSKFIKWQIGVRLNPDPVIHPFTDRSKLIIERGMTGATGNLYCGLHEYSDMSFLLHLLRPEDNFVDIGANIGSYTILASAHIGAKSLSFEPVPDTYQQLRDNINVNNINDRVISYNVALGSSKGSIAFTNSSKTTINHVAQKGDKGTISVAVETLDSVLADEETPILIKVDVEGFETEVIKGGSKTIADARLRAIIIELNGSGARYGYDDHKIHEGLVESGFAPFTYSPKTRQLDPVQELGNYNTIYIRDLPFVNDRLRKAPKITILDQTF